MSTSQSELMNRFKGCFYGLAVGDALGGPLEFKRRSDTRPIVTEMVENKNFDLPPGSWSDDTSMMICIAESLTVTGRGEQDRVDQLERFTRWWREGHNSVNGHCFDIGSTVKTALRRFKFFKNPVALTDDEMFQGNGSLMRLAPVPMMFWNDTERAGVESALSSETTHANSLCKDICKLFGKMVARGLQGLSKNEILATDSDKMSEYDPMLAPVFEGAYRGKTRDEIHSDSWVIHTIETVLWAFSTTETFEEGLVRIVNLAEDADTNGAIYGMLAGAYYGYDAIPRRWLDALQRPDILDEVYVPFIEKVICE